MKKLLVLVATAFLVATAYAGQVQDITIPALKADMATGKVTLLDANGTKSWKEGHIPGAIDFKGSKADLASLLPKDKGAPIVAYCGGPRCVAYKAAVKAAEQLGYTNIKHLPAGISGWKKAGEKMETGS
jgi:rhodanese-related sulfurtransferase